MDSSLLHSYSEEEYSRFLKRIFTPTLLIIGVIGNILSIIIFTRSLMKKHTTFRFLTFLSISDLCALLAGYGQIMFIVYLNIDIRLINEFTCKMHSFLVYFFTQLSSMILMFMSIDRAIVITKSTPVKAHSSTPNLANKLFILAVIAIGLINSHFLLFNNLIEFDQTEQNINFNLNETTFLEFNSSTAKLKACYADPSSLYFIYLASYFPWIDLFLYAIFPTIIMFICSLIIIIKLFKVNGKLKIHEKANKNNKANMKRQSKNKQITYLLIITNLIFFFMVTPLVVLNAFKSIEENTIKTTIVYFLSYANHGVNFIFYGISSENYRAELIKILKCNYFLLGPSNEKKTKINKNDKTNNKYQIVEMNKIRHQNV